MAETFTDNILKAEINLYYDLKPAEGPTAPLLIAPAGAGKRHMMREAQWLQKVLRSLRFRDFTSICEIQKRKAAHSALVSDG